MGDRLIPYVIPHDFGSVAASTTATTSPAITVGPYPFVWTHLTIYMKGTSVDFDIDSIRDQGASINFLKSSVHVNALRKSSTGSSNEWILPQNYRFEQHTAIVIQITNNDAADAGNFEIAFHGYLIMPSAGG